MFDVLIKGGILVDGSGAVPERKDVGVVGSQIVAVDDDLGSDSTEIIQAAGKLVTPGFVDVHTHYDGQATWDDAMLPSSAHGVTTVVMGACGIGFAPVRAGAEDWLVRLMEGVEDIPGTALHDGIPWGWETFPEFLDTLDGQEYALDVAAHLPHSAVRAYVLGERAEDDLPATDVELNEIASIVDEAIRAGAIGVGTSRMTVHRGSDGGVVPGTSAPEDELHAISLAIRDAGGGVLQMLPSGSAGGVEGQEGEPMRVGLTARDAFTLSAEVEMMRRLHRASGQPITFTLAENAALGSEEFARARRIVDQAWRDGEQIFPQFAPRPVGGLVSLDSYHPFSARPTYEAIANLPLGERARRMADPSTKARILAEEDSPVDGGDPRKHTHATLRRHLDSIYDLAQLNYEPEPSSSVLALAYAAGRDPLDLIYDMLIAEDGSAVLIWLATGYIDGNLDRVEEFVEDPRYVMGLGDGGAHVRFICDASFPTFLLAHWGRSRQRGRTFPVEELVQNLTSIPASLYGFEDRGRVLPGLRADLNVIDMDHLALCRPRMVQDLPTGANRFLQDAVGYSATMVAGTITRRDDTDTGARPGRLVRNPRSAQHRCA